MLSAHPPLTPTSAFDRKPYSDSLRRRSISNRIPLAPIGAALPSMDPADGTDDAQSKLRQYRNSTSSLSSRRASLPPFISPMTQTPTSSAFRHRLSVSSVTTTSTSNNDDAVLRRRQSQEVAPTAVRELDVPGLYGGLQTYTFGSASTSHSAPPQQPIASSSSSSCLLPPSKSHRQPRTLSRQSSTTTSSAGLVTAAGTSQQHSPSHSGVDVDDGEMYAGSDVGSAYSPEDDAPFGVSPRRWCSRVTPAAQSDYDDRMDVDSRPFDRRPSRDQGLTTRRSTSPRVREDKKRERNGQRRASASGLLHPREDQENVDLTTDDEEDSTRMLERSKMRAIDDGGRRPSLPINAAPSNRLSSQLHTSLSPLKILTDTSPFGSSQHDRRMSLKSAAHSPSTPHALGFSAIRSIVPDSLYDSSRSSSSPPQSTFSLPSASSPHSRPRSRSVRAAKPLPALPDTMAILNPNDWVAPWSVEARSPSTSPTIEEGQVNILPGLPPPNVNPFVSSPKQPAKNPFVKRTDNGRPSTAGSPKRPVQALVQPARPATTEGSVRAPSPMAEPPNPLSIEEAKPVVSATTRSDTAVNSGDAIAAFDLDFILSGALTNLNQDPNVSDVGVITARKNSLAGSFEDTFVRFVNKFDDDYGERRDRWAFRLDRASNTTPDRPGEYWRCDNLGKYWVGGETEEPGVGFDGFTSDNSITIRFCPSEESSRSEGKVRATELQPMSPAGAHWTDAAGAVSMSSPFYFGGQTSTSTTLSQKRSNVRVEIKKLSKAPAFTLYLGPRGPRALSVSRPSLLLAPKAYHLHNASVPRGKTASISAIANQSHLAFMSADGSTSKPPTSGLRPRSTSASNPRTTSPLNPLPPPLFRSKNFSPHVSSDGESPDALGASPPRLTPSDRFAAQHAAVLLPVAPPVSLDFMSVAAATGRMTSAHKQAFDTLSPEDGQAVLENLKQRTSIGVRLKRAFGARDSGAGAGSRGGDSMILIGGSLSHSVNHSHDNYDSGKEIGRAGSPSSGSLGRHSRHDKDHHHPGKAAHEAAFEPPWLLMTPMYVKEAVVAAERSMYTGFASLGLANVPAPKKHGKRQGGGKNSDMPWHHTTQAMRRNSILDTIPSEAMCMVLPLWDLTLDLQEERRKRHRVIDDLDFDLDDLDEEDEEDDQETEDGNSMEDPETEARRQLAREMRRRRKMALPPVKERKYLLAYYVPFQAKRPSLAATPSTNAVAASAAHSQDSRTSKKRSQNSSSRPSMKRRNSGSGTSSPSSKPLALRSFRVVARILTSAELRDSGLSQPRNIVDPKRMQQQSASYYSSLNYQRMDRRLSSSSILGETVPASFSAVIAVCHDRRRGVEFVPEGLDSLGLCGDGTIVGSDGTIEQLPPLFPPAHMVPVTERLTPPLNAVGKQVVEMLWAGSLALTELGI